MTSSEKLLLKLIESQKYSGLDFTLHIGEKIFSLTDVKITKSPTPVTRPTYRGGVHFSDTFAYKMTGITNDHSIIPLLSKTMLGPNTEFEEIIIKTKATIEGKFQQIVLHAILTNTMQSSSKVELNLIIVKATITH